MEIYFQLGGILENESLWNYWICTIGLQGFMRGHLQHNKYTT